MGIGNTLATFLIKLGLDSSDLDADLKDVERKTTKSMTEMGRNMSKTGLAMTAGITAPITAMGLGALNAASELEQSMGGIESVFNDAQSAILEFGETAADEVGLSITGFNNLATVTGSFLQNLGYDAAGAAEETINLTKRAADMAATFGGPVSAAMGAIQSGLKGEFNPLEQFGVKMNAASISAKALEMGLADASGELTDAAKTTATLAIIMEQTAKTEGQFAREADTVAGSTERAKAQLANMSAELGTQLLPIALKVITAFSGLLDKFTGMSPAGQTAVLAFAGILAAAGPVLTIVGQLMVVVPKLSGFFSGFGTAAKIAGSSVTGMGSSLIGLLGPIALVAAGLAGLVLLVDKLDPNLKASRDATAAGDLNLTGYQRMMTNRADVNTMVDNTNVASRDKDDRPNIIINNPLPETASNSIERTLTNMSYLRVVR